MSTVKISPIPLSESAGSMGDHRETPRMRGSSQGSMGDHTEGAPIPMTSTVNGVKFIVQPGEGEPK